MTAIPSLLLYIMFLAALAGCGPAPNGSVDPLIQALEDQDEQVQARALELLVQDWAREQRAAGSE